MRLLSAIKTVLGLGPVIEEKPELPVSLEMRIQMTKMEEVTGAVRGRYKVMTYGFVMAFPSGRTVFRRDRTKSDLLTLTGARAFIAERAVSAKFPIYYQIFEYNPRTTKTGKTHYWSLIEKGSHEDVSKWLFPEDDEFFFTLRDRLNGISRKSRLTWPGYKFKKTELESLAAQFYGEKGTTCLSCYSEIVRIYGGNAASAVYNFISEKEGSYNAAITALWSDTPEDAF